MVEQPIDTVTPTPATFRFRLQTFFALLAGVRRHDFRSAATFAEMKFPNDPAPVRFVKFLGWAFKQMLIDIPDAITDSRFGPDVSEVPFWLSKGNPWENHPWRNDRSAKLPAKAHTVVIGCGLFGGAMAYHWSKKAGDEKLIVLEMNEAASGSGGRNEGLVVMGRYYQYVHKTVIAHLPIARADLSQADHDLLARQFAAKYCDAAYRNADMLEQTVKDEQFECDYRRTGWIQASDGEPSDQQELAKSAQAAIDSGFKDWSTLTAEQVYEKTGMRVNGLAGFSIAAASFHPAKWIWSLVRTAIDSGKVQLYSRTRVARVEDAGEHYVVHTERGTVQARYVVNATESYTPMLHRQFSNLLRPTQTQAATGDGGPAGIKPHIGISNQRGFYAKHGDQVMVGSDATRVPDHEAGRIQPSRFLTKYLLGELKKIYGHSAYTLQNEWSGTVTYTPDEYPIVGLMDGKRQYIVGGAAGSGTGVSFNSGRCVVNRILGITDEPDDYPEAYFSPTRLLDPANHRWPELNEAESVRTYQVIDG